MKAAFAGFDLFDTALEALAEKCQILEIFTCPVEPEFESNDRVKSTAKKIGIPCREEPVQEEDLIRLAGQGCRLFVCAGYYYRIPVMEGLSMVNIHPSLLPEGRGAWPMPVMLLSGMDEGGVTIHKLSPEFDQGDILLQRRFSIGEKDTLEDVTEQIRGMLPEMVDILVSDLEQLYEKAVPQHGGSFWKCPKKEEYPVLAEMTTAEADRILRAFYGFGCVYRNQGRTWQLLRGRAFPGTALKESQGGFYFPLRDGWILAEKAKELN